MTQCHWTTSCTEPAAFRAEWVNEPGKVFVYCYVHVRLVNNAFTKVTSLEKRIDEEGEHW